MLFLILSCSLLATKNLCPHCGFMTLKSAFYRTIIIQKICEHPDGCKWHSHFILTYFDPVWPLKGNLFLHRFFLRSKLKSKARHTETWSAAAWPPRRVIAQQNFSATFVSLHFDSRKGKLGNSFKNVIISIFSFVQNCVTLKSHNLKLRPMARVCINYW